MGRKDRERFQRFQKINPGYVGYRGLDTLNVRSRSPETETLVCSVCQRKRNVDVTSLTGNTSEFVCLSCREDTVQSL